LFLLGRGLAGAPVLADRGSARLCLDGLALAAARTNRDLAAALLFYAARQLDLEQPALAVSDHLVRLGSVGKLDRASEGAIGPLGEVGLLVLVLVALLATNGED